MPSSASSIRSRSAWLLTSGCCVCGVGGAEGVEEVAAGWEEEEEEEVEVEGREEAPAAPSPAGGTEDSDSKVPEGAASVWRGKEERREFCEVKIQKKNTKKTLMCASVRVFLCPHCCRFAGRDEVAELWDVEVRQSHCGCLQQ